MHLTSWPSREVNCKIPLGTWCFNFQHVLPTWPFVSCPLPSQSQASCKLPCSSQFFTNLSHSTLTLNPINIQGNDWLNTIKIDMELKPIKHNWKLQIYSFVLHYVYFLVFFIVLWASISIYALLFSSHHVYVLDMHTFFMPCALLIVCSDDHLHY